MMLFSLAVVLLSVKSAIGSNEYRIKNEEEFSIFLNNLNAGLIFSKTIFLDADLSLPGVEEPIDKSGGSSFFETFDGQGYVISNFKITSNEQKLGLFGYSTGLTIKNVIMDGSCSITTTNSGSSYMGGLIGYCKAENSPCAIENSVNLGSLKFDGSISDSLYIGGIAGHLESTSGYGINIKNCANYGSVLKSGSSSNSYVGGIVARLSGSYFTHIQNCLNYGAITLSGSANKMYVGGISGFNNYANIENCVSSGKFSLPDSGSLDHVGSITGHANNGINLKYCYYKDDLRNYKMCGSGPASYFECSSYNGATFELERYVSMRGYAGNSLLKALNAGSDCYSQRGYSHWILNRYSKIAAFTINERISPIIISSQVILLPSLASEGNKTFEGWYKNKKLTTPIPASEITIDTELFGRFGENTNNYTISFDTKEGPYAEPKTAQVGSTVSLPTDLTRNDCKLALWENIHGDSVGFNFVMPAQDITLYAVWKCSHIRTPDEFLDFSKAVNAENTFSGETVFLESDLTLFEVTKPVGDNVNYFRGTFDGQGHVISNLILNYYSKYVGLFGYSTGTTIKNVIIDDSCSITSYSSSESYTGGLIGYCGSDNGNCYIKNCVNMASVSFAGEASNYYLYLGGIVGSLYTTESGFSNVSNCANYGPITYSGEGRRSYIGGIAGNMEYKSSTIVLNCLNYGEITHNGTTNDDLFIGGIAGSSKYTSFKNTLSAGKISVSAGQSGSIGSFLGKTDSSVSVNSCYYGDELSYGSYGSGSFTGGVGSETINSNLMETLNENASKYGWNKWLFNTKKNPITFKVNDNDEFSFSSQVIILPSLDRDECTFGWYVTNSFKTPFASNEVSKSTTLYGIWNKLIVKLDANGGSVSPTHFYVEYNKKYEGLSEISTPTRTGYRFSGWSTERTGENIILSSSTVNLTQDHTLYARWTAENYTVNFNANGGDITTEPLTVTYNNTYGELPTPTREGYTFAGWSLNNLTGSPVNSSTTVLEASNHTLYAHWSGNNYTVLLDADGGNNEVPSKVVTYGSPYGDLQNPTRTGYEFVGWFTETPGGTQITKDNTVSFPYDHMIYAHWNAIKYTITFDSYGGSPCASITQECDSYVVLPTPSKAGFTFAYWYKDSEENEYDSIRIPPESFTLYAHWNPNNYTVSIDKKCGVSGDPFVVTYGKQYEGLPSVGSDFREWNVVENGMIVKSGDLVETASNHTLCAVWNSFVVTFDPAEGTISRTTNTYNYNDKYTGLLDPTRQGYSFLGWFTETGTGPVTEDTNITTPYPHTLKAHWKIDTYILTFDFGYRNKKETMKITYNDPIYYPYVSVREGYTFKGWSSNEKTMPNNDLTITAKWEAINYTVTFDLDNGNTINKTFNFNDNIIYPACTKEGYSFVKWNDNIVSMPSRNLTIKAVWKANTYIVTFDENGGNKLEVNKKRVTFDSAYGFLPNPTGDGFNFAGWYGGGNSMVTENTIVKTPNDHTLKAIWTSNSLVVTLDLNGGSGVTNTTLTVAFNEKYGKIPEPIRTGYEFSGWFNDGNKSITNNSTVEMPYPHTLHARWTAITYTVTFDVNGGSELTEEEKKLTVTFDAAYGKLPEPTKEGYLLMGWFTEEDELIAKDTLVKIPNNHVLKAKWGKNMLIVTLDLNGGSGVANTTLVVEFNEEYGEIPEPTRTGYKFDGWFNNDNLITKDTEVSITVDHTLHAKWIGNTYTVTLDVNGGSELTEEEKEITVIFGDIYGELKAPQRTGYTFAEWITEDNESVANDTEVKIAKDHNLTAKWTANTYIVTLDVKGGNKLSETEFEVTFDSAYGELPTPSGEGREFVAWLTDNEETVTKDTIVNIPNNHTLHANWGENRYEVILDVNGGESSISRSIFVTYNQNYGDIPEPTRAGYKFAGWFTDRNETAAGERVTKETTVTIPHAHSLYAKWEAMKYTVTLDVNGGHEMTEKEITVTFDDSYRELPAATRAGYTFVGWFTEDNEGVTNEAKVKIAKDHTLAAHWSANTYTVTLDVNGGNKLPEIEFEVTFDEPYKKFRTPKRTGYTFAGWFTDGNESAMGEAKVAIPRDHTIHAHWTANQYVAVFDANGGEGLSENEISVYFDSPYGTLPTGLTKTGHTFAWWTESLFNGTEISSDTNVRIPGNHTLYAVWNVNKYTITFKTESGAPIYSVLNYDDRIIYPNENPSKPFYTFRKWCTTDIDNTEQCNVTHVPAGNLTFTPSYDVDTSLVAGTAAAVGAGLFVIVLILVIVFLVKVIVINRLRVRYRPVDIEMGDDLSKREEVERRIKKQMATTNVFRNVVKKLEDPLRKADRGKALEEVFMDLDIDFEDDGSTTKAIESYRVSSASSVVADSIRDGKDLVFAAEYLGILYESVRNQEDYMGFKELYFGMKDFDDFMDNIDEKIFRFGGIVSAFTNERKVVELLMHSDEDGEDCDDDDEDNKPRGVLFEVRNARGYKIGMVDEKTEEVLLELGCAFRMASMKEVIRDRYAVVSLVFVSPVSENELTKL